MAVNSRQKLIDYCMRSLGAPVVKINVDIEQVYDRVEEALEYFREYHYDGIEKVYLKHQITQDNIDTQSILVSDSLIYGVNRIIHIGNSSTTDWTSIGYQLRIDDIYSLLGADLINYTLAQQHYSLLQDILVGHKQFRYNRITDTIHLDFSLKDNYKVGDYILVDCYRVLDPATTSKLWGNQWLKHYTTALIKMQWATNLKKFNGLSLPGGVNIDGDSLYAEADKEIDELKEELLNKSAPLEWFIG